MYALRVNSFYIIYIFPYSVKNFILYKHRCFRGWDYYTEGFGNIEANYWLGLRKLAKILHSGTFELFVFLESFEPNEAVFARYQLFNVSYDYIIINPK